MTVQVHPGVQKDHVLVGVFGTGGFARETMPLVHDSLSSASTAGGAGGYSICFVEEVAPVSEVNGYPLITEEAFFSLDCSRRLFSVAIGNSRSRQRVADRCMARGATPLTLRAASSIIYDRNAIGEGAILCANTIVTSNAVIGRFFEANIFSYVAHDCVIGDFVTFAPNVHCNGNVHIHDHAYIGTGAIIKHGLPSRPLMIGEGAIVGMGAVVTKDVAAHTTVVGNPARVHTGDRPAVTPDR